MSDVLARLIRPAAAIVLVGGLAFADISATKHNLSVTGPGTVKISSASEICIFCHTPHNTQPSTPLWNRSLSTLVYTPYASSTMQASPGQPTHASKLCLSCHDGTIGIGHVSRQGDNAPFGPTLTGRPNLTTDLSDDHPISFLYNNALATEDRELVSPATLTNKVCLDAYGQMQCTTCHEAHGSSNPNFLVVDNQYSALCITCHRKQGWSGAAHATSQAAWNGGGADPWPYADGATVAINGCENCHTSHAAGLPERLLVYPEEQDNCLSCHNGNVAGKNIDSEIRKTYAHAVASFSGIHDPAETTGTMPRHVECSDCHNPHAATNANANAPLVSGALERVEGVSLGGADTTTARYQYEVCFRCHADGANVPAPAIRRQIHQPNLRLKFQMDNPSAHPVAGPGQNPDVPSLIYPWTENSQIYCTDCHASDSGPNAGGAGAAGPHGSVWPFLLEREYRTADYTAESYQSYALCYKCHDRASILSDASFKRHRRHIVDLDTPCSVCHDPHGISATQGNAQNNTHLINFDTTIVSGDMHTGTPRFEDLGTNRGRCFLSCHGRRHSPKGY
ncbi:MAG: hypothetical protein GWP08_01230 [Nitrospiraceae bacterium]|nr:hypothetical protein [Nitrospiraceae bacterium]